MGKTEKINHRIKKTLAKIFQETHLKWDQALFIALLQIRAVPQHRLKLSSFGIVYEVSFQFCFRNIPFKFRT